MLIISVLGGGVAGVAILFFGRSVISLWAGPGMVPGAGVLAGFAAYSVLMGVGGSLTAYLNNDRFLHRQAALYVFASVVAVLLKVLLVRAWKDPSGAVWATVFAYTLVFVVPATWAAFSTRRS